MATGVADGDLSVRQVGADLDGRRRAVVDRPWMWLDQVHGAAVVTLGPDDDVAAVAGSAADAVVTARADVALAVHTADCAPVGLVSGDGLIGAVHAGWRGLRDGVLVAAVTEMRHQGATDIAAVLGPCIGVECYRFGDDGLAAMVDLLGPTVRGLTREGEPALDLRRGVEVALAAAGVAVVAADPTCTACGEPAGGPPSGPPGHWSHRARADTGRQALVVWLDRTGDGP
ncbi:MAG: polyphenol oxidase family protein [Acidimicrobiales bacterium]|nr:polyphenol oxidase family protein [Acidimicrobiales bacterium]